MDRFVVLLFTFLCIQTIKFSFCSMDSKVVCITRERQALLIFKQGLRDRNNWLSSWTGEECCKWKGIGCDNRTGHVLNLNLRQPFPYGYSVDEEYMGGLLGGKISPSLVELKHLKYLDLSSKDFGGIHIPEFLGSLKSLRYLNLSNAGFAGMVPHQLGNLSSLRYLDLSCKSLSLNRVGDGLHVKSFGWLSHLSFLKHLDMSGVNLGKASDYLQMMNMLPSLSELHLSYCLLGDTLALPIPYVNFTSLTVIDLSFNNFNSSVPNWVLGISGLVSLNLNSGDFHGPIPYALQNLTSLRVLDLSWNNFRATIPDWLYNFNSLVSLDLRYNNLRGTISSLVGNLTSLTSLHLSGNVLEGRIPSTLGSLCKLRELDLAYNNLNGEIDGLLGSLSGCIVNSSLEVLDLGQNKLSGHLPYQLGRLTSLRVLRVATNQLNGTLPESLGCLSKLEELSISSNSLVGLVSEVYFPNLTRLKRLDASLNSLVLKVPSDWIPPFQLKDILLGSWLMGPQFPAWLRSQTKIFQLDLSITGISDKIPTWFRNISSQIYYLDLSYNQIHGEISSFLNLSSHTYYLELSGNQIHGEIPSLLNLGGMHLEIYLYSNRFKGPLPYISSNVDTLDLSNNAFSGPISHFLCQKMDEPSILGILDLSGNYLSGELPECLMNWQQLGVIKLGNNNLTGKVPSSIGSLFGLQALSLKNNMLSGELPLSLQNCMLLRIIHLAKNKFSGSIPTWMGESFSKLKILDLRSNSFSGSIPPKLCNLTSLQVLDVAHNNLSGTIPRCFGNFNAMVIEQKLSSILINGTDFMGFPEEALLAIKGRESIYSQILGLVVIMDLSVNQLSGEIPKELAHLIGLQSLNLSGNNLTGKIPGKIGDMWKLESLDLSLNKLSGGIPQSMSNLTFLNHLNLSYNNLSGRIPLSTQLQSFSATSYVGNQDLCGFPSMNICTEDNTSNNPVPSNDKGGNKDGHHFEMVWFSSSMALGFGLGFWIVCGPLLFNKSWRFFYFRLLGDKLFWWYQ